MKMFPIPALAASSRQSTGDPSLRTSRDGHGPEAIAGRPDAEALSEARSVLAEFADALGPWDPAVARYGPRLDLSGLLPPARDVLDHVLGEGAVKIRVSGPRPAHIDESAFTGIWRVRELDPHGGTAGEWLEAATLPEAALHAALIGAAPDIAAIAIPSPTTSASIVLDEVARAMRNRAPGARAHIVNLTFSALTAQDRRALDSALPEGPVTIDLRGAGNCRVSSTQARHVWRVRYFDAADRLILDTLEVVAVPEGALATIEDLQDSRERFEELVAWIGEDSASE